MLRWMWRATAWSAVGARKTVRIASFRSFVQSGRCPIGLYAI